MVNRCVCLNCSFPEIAHRNEKGQSLDQIVKETGCGTVCGMCQSYIKAVIATKNVAFKPGEDFQNKISEIADPEDW